MQLPGTHFNSLDALRGWLSANHECREPVWIRFYKRSNPETISYADAVEEALCWGWIDSLIKRVDDDLYLRKFTRRNPGSPWSATNRERVKRLLAAGRMQPSGLALIEGVDLDAGSPNPATVAPTDPPPPFAEALAGNPKAAGEFAKLPPSHKKRYIGWILSAKREETRRNRAAEATAMLEFGKRLEGK